MRICKAQIKNERAVSKRCFEELAAIETNEILSLIAEEEILEDFSSVWEAKLTKVTKGTPPYFMVVNQIDAYDLRLDVGESGAILMLVKSARRRQRPQRARSQL